MQQPVVQVPPQLHAPCLHSCPVAHAAHRAPPVPHAVLVPAVMQTSLMSQQPVEHVVALHGLRLSGRTTTSFGVPRPSPTGSMETSVDPSRPALPSSGFAPPAPASLPVAPPRPEVGLASRVSNSGRSNPRMSAHEGVKSVLARSIMPATRERVAFIRFGSPKFDKGTRTRRVGNEI